MASRCGCVGAGSTSGISLYHLTGLRPRFSSNDYQSIYFLGGFVDGQGDHVAEGQQHVFMVTNLCPNEWPNLSWCSQSSHNGYKNHYGYPEHFDLEDGAGQIAAIGWKGKNPEVTWEYVDCNWVSTICDVGR